MALAVPLVSFLLLWCDSITRSLYPANAPGKVEAIISITAWNATTCTPRMP